MKLIDERGNKINIPNEQIPEPMKEWLYSSVQMLPDDAKLEKCWVAVLNKQQWGTKTTYEYITEEVYDHQPTKEELLWLMVKNNALRFSYVEISECYRLHEEDD